jgi:cytochrome c oxidase assembly protein subunit 15
MVMALVIVALIIGIIKVAKNKTEIKKYNGKFRILIIVSLLFSLFQIISGTQVREFIDEQVNAGIGNEYLWLNNPTLDFYIHRSFSFVILFINVYLFYLNRHLRLGFNKMKWVMVLLILNILTGVLMYYIHFPFGSQAAHLVLATILFGIQFQLTLEARKCYYSGKSTED